MNLNQAIDVKLIVESMLYLGVFVALIVLSLNVYVLVQIFKKNRTFEGIGKKNLVWVVFIILFVVLYTACFYYLPNTFLPGYSWNNLVEIASGRIFTAAGIWYFSGILLLSYFILDFTFGSRNNKSLLSVSLLSIISGFSGTLIIMVVNQVAADMNHLTNWILYFAFAVTLSVGGVKITQMKLVTITNQIVYEKRVVFIEMVLQSRYDKIEKMEEGNIQTCLNNDTEEISNFAGTFVTILTSAMTTLGCFIYLGVINLYALLLSIAFIVIASSLVAVTFKKVNHYWEENRDIQNRFFKFIGDLTAGFKELKLNRAKNEDFKNDMIKVTQDYIRTKVKGEQKFVNTRALGELIYYLLLGFILFLFPALFKGITQQELMAYLLILIYIAGQIIVLLSTTPQLLPIKISWDRLNKTIKEMESLKDSTDAAHFDQPDLISLQLKDVKYQYKNKSGNEFTVGPLNCEFHSGEITFITGGNGSGKSTLAKLITGLYVPDEGEITLNGELVQHDKLGEYFSTVFSDFYLFDKLYGIQYEKVHDKLEHYLQTLQLKEKVNVENGMFSTTQLSTGQKKRLALLVNYLEDSPIFLFDEWAADQDPQFRKFFYHTLLPDMRERGKCIIAITHDDHYFSAADKIIKLEMGRMVDISQDDVKQADHGGNGI